MAMSEPPKPGTGAGLELNSPLSQDNLARLVSQATSIGPQHIVDHGCGWGEVLLQALAVSPTATGMGIDLHGPDLVRARTAADERGLSDRVEFVAGSSPDHRAPADLLISVGAYHAFGSPLDAMKALREDLRPGGRAIFGLECWAQTPTTEELENMWPDASVDDCLDLAALVAMLHQADWRILDFHESTRAELDAYEIGHLHEREAWLVSTPESTRREHSVRTELDSAWMSWLRGHRRPMTFVTFVLG